MIRAALLVLALAFGGGAFHFGLLDGAPGAKVGNHADPNGTPATGDAGGSADPDGLAATGHAGNNLDPNG